MHAMNKLSNFIKRVVWRCLHPLILRFAPCEWRSIDDLPPQADEDDEWEIRCVVVWQDTEHDSDQGVEVTNLAQIRDGDFHQDRYSKPVWRTVMDAPTYTQAVFDQSKKTFTNKTMNEPTKYEAAVAQMLLENKQQNDEWEWQMKMDKIEQNHDFLNERDNQENEEA